MLDLLQMRDAILADRAYRRACLPAHPETLTPAALDTALAVLGQWERADADALAALEERITWARRLAADLRLDARHLREFESDDTEG